MDNLFWNIFDEIWGHRTKHFTILPVSDEYFCQNGHFISSKHNNVIIISKLTMSSIVDVVKNPLAYFKLFITKINCLIYIKTINVGFEFSPKHHTYSDTVHLLSITNLHDFGSYFIQ